jgi:5-methylcytosine-specific restriction endonuclease McrA
MNSTVSKALRHIVFERDSYTCVLCDNPAYDVHHAIERSRGGRNILWNLVSLCRPCHMKLHHELPADSDELIDMEVTIHEYLDAVHPDEYYKMFVE